MPELKVLNQKITYLKIEDEDYISITDMLKSKDGDFFVSDWLRNRNTIEFLGIWEEIHNPNFNYGEFAIIKSQAGLNSYKIIWLTLQIILEIFIYFIFYCNYFLLQNYRTFS